MNLKVEGDEVKSNPHNLGRKEFRASEAFHLTGGAVPCEQGEMWEDRGLGKRVL